MKFFKLTFATLVLVVVSVSITVLVPGCKSNYKPVAEEQLKNYPECVFAMNTFKAYEDSKEKSGVVLPGKACLDAIKRQRCIREIWHRQDVDGYWMPEWDDVMNKSEFASCMIGM